MFIFEKHPSPITLEQKYRLILIGSFCINEEVKSAAFGSLRLAAKKAEESKPDKIESKRLHYAQ